MRKELKFLLKFILLVLVPVTAGQAQDSKEIAEIVGSSEKIIKGTPFSAEVISESVQVLADGNKIARKMTTRMYRDSAGRFRRDDMPNPGGILGSVIEFPQTLFIIDPVIGTKFYLNPASKTARQQPLKTNMDWKAEDIAKRQRQRDEQEKQRAQMEVKKAEAIAEQQKLDAEQRKRWAEMEVKKAEAIAKQQKLQAEAQAIKDEAIARQAGIITKQSPQNAIQTAKRQNPTQEEEEEKDNPISPDTTTTESLGVKNIEGVQTEGTRTTSTIAAGKIGNERAINIIYERWYSKDLQLIILSKYSDPRFGEQIYRLTNINRSEPDRSLFSLPANYKIVNPFPPKPTAPPKEK